MKKELVEPAVKAIDALIAAELESTSPARYENISKLCNHAHAIVQMAARRVKDVAGGRVANIAVGGNNLAYADQYQGFDYEPVMDAVEAPVRALGRADQTDLLREMISAFQAFSGPKPKSVEDRLNALLDLRERLTDANKDCKDVDAQIDELLPQVRQALAEPALLAAPDEEPDEAPADDEPMEAAG
jgi:hypothetical protein